MQHPIRLAASILIAASLASVAVAKDKAGVRDPAAFDTLAERTEIVSALPYAELARCFEERGRFLPMTEFARYPETNEAVYRLRGFGYWFERVSFQPTAEGGSVAVVQIAPNLNKKWRRDFDRDRLAPLQLCAAPSSL